MSIIYRTYSLKILTAIMGESKIRPSQIGIYASTAACTQNLFRNFNFSFYTWFNHKRFIFFPTKFSASAKCSAINCGGTLKLQRYYLYH